METVAVRQVATHRRSDRERRICGNFEPCKIWARGFGESTRDHPRAAVTSTSTLNSGRVKPETTTRVEAKAPVAT
jgi:hypothetical protein